MRMKRHSKPRGRGSWLASVAVVVFAASGTTLIGISLASQRSAPDVPTTIASSPASPGAGVTTSGSPFPSTSSGIPATDEGSAQVVAVTLPRSEPVSLDIPSIGVRSVIQHLGQTSDGALETPAPGPHYNEAAWYRYSPTPGSLGPAVVLGHIDSASDGPSVFFRLGELRPGDRVSITRVDGSVVVFAVDEIHRYSKEDFPTDLVYGDIDHAGLRLITCGGAFDETTRHYLDNIVVFASLIDPAQLAPAPREQ